MYIKLTKNVLIQEFCKSSWWPFSRSIRKLPFYSYNCLSILRFCYFFKCTVCFLYFYMSVTVSFFTKFSSFPQALSTLHRISSVCYFFWNFYLNRSGLRPLKLFLRNSCNNFEVRNPFNFPCADIHTFNNILACYNLHWTEEKENSLFIALHFSSEIAFNGVNVSNTKIIFYCWNPCIN